MSVAREFAREFAPFDDSRDDSVFDDTGVDVGKVESPCVVASDDV